jgi:hypothetical protein
MTEDVPEPGSRVVVKNVREIVRYIGKDGVGNAICETIVAANKKPQRRAFPMADVQKAPGRHAMVAKFKPY